MLITYNQNRIKLLRVGILLFALFCFFFSICSYELYSFFSSSSSSPPPSSIIAAQEEDQKKKEKQKIITEEIVVEAPLPKDIPLSTTSLIKREKIESLSPKDLSEVLSYTSGTFISSGSKNEFRIKIRGFESQRIVLLYDGIPIYEPFFNSFDLKTIPAEEVENIKVVKGASSVLYGPNALGGIINIITRRPRPPSFSLKTLYGSNDSLNISSSGALNWKNVFFSGFASFDKSDGFKCNKNGENTLRENSDYERRNVTGKVYYYPNQKSEILLEAAYYWSEFGVPLATEYYFPRYWRFKSWNRLQLNLGGTFSLLKNGHLKFRSYYVRHDNILDAFTDASMNELMWESTYDNDSYGAFLLGTVPYLARNELKFSLNYRDDNIRTQDDRGGEWEEFQHQTFSVGFENHFGLNPRLKLAAGVNLDYLRKYSGDNKTSLNPILGLKFNPYEYIDIHLTFSQKSRFPSMKSLYSSLAGNPDLKDERGTSYEFGLRYERSFLLSSAIFYNRIKDLIGAVRLPSGFQTNLNIGKANIFGFELEAQKVFSWMSFSANYTYLKARNEEEERPLDLVPESQLNFVLHATAKNKLQFTLWGLAVSSSEVKIFDDIVRIPGYFVLNAVLSKSFSNFAIFIKGENLFNKYYVTEPGYPMRARTVSVGLKFRSGGEGGLIR
jgi:outer membrane receptor protein involved in Fe transport